MTARLKPEPCTRCNGTRVVNAGGEGADDDRVYDADEPCPACTPQWGDGDRVRVVSGKHAGTRGVVLRFEAITQRLYIFVKGIGGIGVDAKFCKRIEDPK